MSNTNVVVITGNMGDDVDYRVFPQTGNGVAELRVAVNKHRLNQQTGQFDTYTAWVTVKMFGKLAERANEKLSKGAKVTVTGELAEDNWEDQPTGQKRSKLYVVGNSFEYLGGGTRAPQGDDQGGSNYQGNSQSRQNQGGQRSRQGQQRQGNNTRQSNPRQQTNTGATRPAARPAGY